MRLRLKDFSLWEKSEPERRPQVRQNTSPFAKMRNILEMHLPHLTNDHKDHLTEGVDMVLGEVRHNDPESRKIAAEWQKERQQTRQKMGRAFQPDFSQSSEGISFAA